MLHLVIEEIMIVIMVQLFVLCHVFYNGLKEYMELKIQVNSKLQGRKYMPKPLIKIKNLYAVSVSTYQRSIVILVDAYSKKHAKNLAEAKYYEKNPRNELLEARTMVWKVNWDESARANPSRR